MDHGLLNRRFMNRALAMQAVLVAAAAMAFAATAESASPQAFVDGIYKHYLGKDSKGLALSSAAVIRRYFAPPLADAIIKDFAAAHKAGEVPLLNGDPFIDAQDWEISNLKTAVKIDRRQHRGRDRDVRHVHGAAHRHARSRQHAGRLADHRHPVGEGLAARGLQAEIGKPTSAARGQRAFRDSRHSRNSPEPATIAPPIDQADGRQVAPDREAEHHRPDQREILERRDHRRRREMDRARPPCIAPAPLPTPLSTSQPASVQVGITKPNGSISENAADMISI